MSEHIVRVRFDQPCLGAHAEPREIRKFSREGVPEIRTEKIFALPRFDGQVTFPPAWWRALTRYGAMLKGGNNILVDRIEWGMVIDGTPRLWQRWMPTDPRHPNKKRNGYAQHEAFLAGDVISVDCILPPGLKPEALCTYLTAAGKHRGLSPYKHVSFGRFTPVEVIPKEWVAKPVEQPELIAEM